MYRTSVQPAPVVVDAVVVLTLTRRIKSVVSGQALVTLEWKKVPGEEEKTTQNKSGTCIHDS